jgi:uncharacterized protein with FMN-binding domain
METETTHSSLITKIISGVIAILALIGIVLYVSDQKTNITTTSTETTTGEPAYVQEQTKEEMVKTDAGSKALPTTLYKDGTYRASGSYSSPAGKDTLSVSLTIANDTVTSATFTGEATHPASKKWQSEFSDGFSQAVVGKKINDLNLTIVNGSSLTPKGFMDALEKIKQEAKSL